MRQATNCFLINPHGDILLSMKKRGFGVGKLNGAGGKLQEGETAEQAAIREAEEEIGVVIDIKDLEKVGEIVFRNPDQEWGMFVHIYRTRKWKGEPTESDEMKPAWYDPKEVTFDKTWPDLPHYFQHIVNGEKFKGEFVYKEDGETLDRFDVIEIENFG